jgi:hypothetical protein
VKLAAGDHPTAFFTGLQSCGLIWACPVCGPKIRQQRAEHIDQALQRWMDLNGPRTVAMLTLTLPHYNGERLRTVLGAVRSAFGSLVSGRAWQDDKKTYGLAHYIRSHDVTHGANGWHPHLHIILLADRPITEAEVPALRARLWRRWHRAIARLDRSTPSLEHGIDLELARSYTRVAQYACQVAGETTGSSLAMETARGDLKRSRHGGHRTPWQIAEDGVIDPNPTDAKLWREWELTMRGVQAIRWSRGLRARLMLQEAEPTDEELAAIERAGVVIGTVPEMIWRLIARRPRWRGFLRRAVELQGERGLARALALARRSLTSYRSGAGVRSPIA